VSATTAAEPVARDWRQTLVDRPAIALTGVLAVLYVVTATQAPGMFTFNGVRSTLLLACPLAILAASQTLCMLTAGIDLSTVMTANFAAYVAANQSGQGPLVALGLAMCVGLAVGLVNGIGVGVFKVNPLIMTLGMASVLLGVVTVGLVGDGFLSGSTRLLPVLRTVASGTLFGPIPNNLVLWALVAAALIFGLARTGLGRAIYAVGDNPVACRLAGVRIWQVLLAVYVMSALLASLAGLLFSGISGTSILGGVGGYTGTILGALILTVLNRLLLALDTTEAFRQILYGLIVLALAWVYVRITGQRGT
jgi:ribose transport system permease protein